MIYGRRVIRTVKQTLDFASNCFRDSNISTYRLDAEILVSHVLNIERPKLYTEMEEKISILHQYRINRLITRRCKYEPMAYILGSKEFYGLTFLVDRNVLIPRPETEFLVEQILQYDLRDKKVLDIGTGTGNIGITIKKMAPSAEIVCVDISSKALKIAEKNQVRILKKKCIRFIKSDIYSNVSDKYDVIASNPPYILSEEMNRLSPDVKNFEPGEALNGGSDGMKFYNRIISGIPKFLKKGGYFLLEIDPGLKKKILSFAHQYGLKCISVIKDYNNMERTLAFRYED